MTEQSQDRLIATPEPVSGLNKNFLIVLIMGVVVFISGIVLMMFIQAKPGSLGDVRAEHMALSSERFIEKMKEAPNQPVDLAQTPETPSKIPNQAQPSVNEKVFELAGSAPISAYRQEPVAVEAGLSAAKDLNTQVDTDNQQSALIQPNKYDEQNGQSAKQAFLAQQKTAPAFLSQQRVHNNVSPYVLSAGTILPATLLTGINSDLPNQIIAKIRRPVFDTRTGNYLLVPQGATLIGVYDSKITYGQQRLLIAWSRIIFPNGASINLEGQPGADLAGMSGVRDKVNHHRLKVFSSALMMSLFGAAGQLSQPRHTGNGLSNAQIIYGAIGQQLSQTAAMRIAKNMDIQPTLTIRPGMNFNVLMTRDFVFPGAYRFDV